MKKNLFFIENLIGKSICYAIKSPDTELYDFGFGNPKKDIHFGKPHGMYILHALCRFKVIWKKERMTDVFFEDTSQEEFKSKFHKIIGMEVKKCTLSDKNDLWLDFEDFYIVFATYENHKESWRLFFYDEGPHFIASDNWIFFK